VIRKLVGRALTSWIAWRVVSAATAGAVKMAAMIVPEREVDVFAHRNFAHCRCGWYWDVFMAEPGWLFIEAGGWTLEVAWKPDDELVARGA
jgi:hypothetical protein